jgi:hypothetical protein
MEIFNTNYEKQPVVVSPLQIYMTNDPRNNNNSEEKMRRWKMKKKRGGQRKIGNIDEIEPQINIHNE